ncbi:ABC transporter permease [Streptacidiphilus jiangxiensis]|uniref:Putative ABC transport system permease protein n=1 Tax=Streptacidiphilus jiangxiensis TaxID=235985 RepID=A0A1H7RPK9_STRJI|nr:FtsX-like permease family protein [Streptacidiphilus jiangxiensis]SEL62171.1 putative ABC transport system permease protein [Streptacidiphilus jiangxiensis]
MHLALLELKAARGRFLLMGAVVVLVAALVGIVSGFTTGLGDDTVSALRRLSATDLAFSPDVKTDQFARSLVGADTLAAWQRQPGVRATGLGVALTRGTTERGVEVDLAAFGVDPAVFLSPGVERGARLAEDGQVVVSGKLADQGVRIGDTLTVDRIGVRLTVVGVTGSSAYGHVPVAYVTPATWQRIRFAVPGAQQATAELPYQYSAVAIQAVPGTDLAAVDRRLGTRTVPLADAFAAAPGYSGEKVTMTSIQTFLYLIAPLVVGAFFGIWTVQRQPELALLRALGASRRRLLGHTLAQASAVVVGGTLVGAALAGAVGLLLGAQVPFSLPAPTLAATMATVALAGLAGAALTLRRVATADPTTMLGAGR